MDICIKCGKYEIIQSRKMCANCYMKTKQITVYVLGEKITIPVPPGENPDEFREMVKSEKNKMVEEAISNLK